MAAQPLTVGELESRADEGPCGQIAAQRLVEDLLRLVVLGKLHASVQHLSLEPRGRRSGRSGLDLPHQGDRHLAVTAVRGGLREVTERVADRKVMPRGI